MLFSVASKPATEDFGFTQWGKDGFALEVG